MKQKVWILNHYASVTYSDNGGRHYNFAKYLKRFGHDPVIFCCNAKHNSNAGVYFDDNSLWHEHIAEGIDVPFVFVRGRAYVGNGKQRVLNMVDFYRNVKKTAKEYAKEHGKPDVILASSVHPLTLVAGIQLAKYFGVKCICEVRDLWPESIVAYSSRLKKSNPIIKLLYAGEKWIYKKADALVFTMEGGRDYIIEKGWDTAHGGPVDLNKVHHINNGVDLEVFDYNKEHYQIDDPDLEDPNTFKVVYTGSVRRVNNLGLLLDAAKQVADPKIKFLIWGDGDERAVLEKRKKEESITNVVFKGRVDKKYVPYIVSHADLNFIHGVNSSLMRFGISPNKLFDYFAAGKPVLMDFKANYNPALDYSAGVSCDISEPTVLAEAFERFAQMQPEQYEQFCRNARKAAAAYDFSSLTSKLIRVIEGA